MISVILPSMKRVSKLLRSVKNIQETTPGHEVEIVVVLNADDRASHEALEGKNLHIVDMPLDCPPGRPHKCWQAGYKASSGQWVVQTADDVIFNPDWLNVLEIPNKGFIGLREVRWHDMMATLFMATPEYIETMMGGHFGLPWYYVAWSDNEITYRAKQNGTFAMSKELQFTHMNFNYAKEAPDEYGVIATRYYGADQVTFSARLKANFPSVWPEV